MSDSSKRTILIAALAVFAAIGMVAMPALGATTTLTGDGTDTVSNYSANASDAIEYSISADGTDFDTDGSTTLFMNVSYDGVEHGLVEASVDDGTAASQNITMNHSDFETLPGGANETVTVTVEAWGEDDDGNTTTPATSFDVDVTFDESHAAVYMDDDSASIESQDAGFFSLNTIPVFDLGDEPADLHTYEGQSVAINGSATTVTLYDATANGSDVFSDTLGDEMSSGDVITGASAGLGDTPVLAFYDSADSDTVDDSMTYAVYDSDSGVWTFHLGDDYSDATSVEPFVSSQSYTSIDAFGAADLGSIFVEQASFGTTDLFGAFGLDAIFSFGAMDLIPFVGMLGNGLLLSGVAVSRRRPSLG